MEISKEVIHYPTLRTVLMIEQVIKNSPLMISREEIKRRLPVKIMHQTLNLVLRYLEERGMILDSRKGILWIYNDSRKLKKEISQGREV